MNNNSLKINRISKRLPVSKQVEAFRLIKEIMGEKISIRKACEKVIEDLQLDISVAALIGKYYRMNKNGEKIFGNMIFSGIEEESLVGLIEGFSLLNKPLSRSMLIEHVHTLRPNLLNWEPKFWVTHFLERHKSRIKNKILSGINSSRINKNTLDNVKEFVKVIGKIIDNKNQKENLIFNADETRLSLKIENYSLKGIEYVKKVHNSIVMNEDKKCASYIPFISRNKLFLNFLVFPMENDETSHIYLKKVTSKRNNNAPVYFLFTKSGWVNTEAWLLILSKFIEEIRKINLNDTVLLFLDKLNIHMNIEGLMMCKKQNVNVCFFPTYCTHFIQPCDITFFQMIKKYLLKKYHELLVKSKTRSKNILMILASSICDIENIISNDVISNSWEKVGLIPFEPEKIINNAKINIGEVQDTDESTFSIQSRNLAMKFINDTLLPDNIHSIRIKPSTSKIYTRDEILEEKEKQQLQNENDNNKKKNKLNKNTINITSTSSSKRMKNEMKIYKCFNCRKKNKWMEKNLKNETERCCKCGEFVLCKDCYCKIPEILFLHEENCEGN